MRRCARWKRKNESAFSARPIPKIAAPRAAGVPQEVRARRRPLSARRAKENAIETPTMKRKNGKIVSV